MHIQDLVRVHFVRIAGPDVEVGTPFFVVSRDGHMDHQLVLAVVAMEVEQSFVLVGGHDLQVLVQEFFVADVAGNGLLELFDNFLKFRVVHGMILRNNTSVLAPILHTILDLVKLPPAV